jgi:hypothetical protein
VDQVAVENFDGYSVRRNIPSRIKEMAALRQFLAFCADREWSRGKPGEGF